MSRSVIDLSEFMRAPVADVINRCAKQGVDILIYQTLRSPQDQARAYRRSRTLAEIKNKEKWFTDRGYHFLAEILMSVGPQFGVLGAHITNAGPGESWHQYRQALDAVPMRDGKLLWDTRLYREEWAIYWQAINDAGLHRGPSWDGPHMQVHDTHNPLDMLNPDDVKAILEAY